MIKIFYGPNRVSTEKAIKLILGKEYEVFEAETLTRGDMDSIFYGTSLFGDKRKILIKDLDANTECWEALPNYNQTDHVIVIWASSFDKKKTINKKIAADKGFETRAFEVAEDPDKWLSFDVGKAAFAGEGRKAIKLCKKLEMKTEPQMFMGGLVSQALKRLNTMNDAKSVKILKILAQADVDMKTSKLEPWAIMEMALLKIANLS